MIVAGGDPDQGTASVFVLDADGRPRHQSRKVAFGTCFYHTGLWQTWSPDARHVCLQAGTPESPRVARWTPDTEDWVEAPGEIEGAPPSGEPILCAKLSMLYAAGFGDRHYHPDASPVPFQSRHEHGLFEIHFDPPSERLKLSVADFLERHPHRQQLAAADAESCKRNGDGLTLMLYCVRWSPDGSRFLFYFGNHTTPGVPERDEPKVAYVFTSDRSLKDFHLALDLSFNRRGVHWSWQPDNEHLIGYGPDPAQPETPCLAEVRYDGTGYRKISPLYHSGHPSVSPSNPDLIVTDSYGPVGQLQFISRRTGNLIAKKLVPLHSSISIPPGRSRHVVDLHPVFHPSGQKILVNHMNKGLSQVGEIEVPKSLL